MARALFLSVVLVVAVPIGGYVSMRLIEKNVDGKFREAMIRQSADFPTDFSITDLCKDPVRVAQLENREEFCGPLRDFAIVEDVAVATGIAGLAYLFLVLFGGALTRSNRKLLVAFFKPGLRFTQVFVSLLILSHGAILIASLYFTESYWVGRIHLVAMLGAAIAIVATVIRTFGTVFSGFKSSEIAVTGTVLPRAEAPRTWKLVEEVAAAACTKPPDNIVVGITPDFFVTEAPVRASDGAVSGRTLHLSLPFCRLLTADELKTIVAHELGHFVGEDTKFSQHFYPIYRGAGAALEAIQNQSSGSVFQIIAALPSIWLMSFFVESFARAETRIGRSRELAADALAGTLFGKPLTAAALVKVHAYAKVWGALEERMLEAIDRGAPVENSAVFFEATALALPRESVEQGLSEFKTHHPMDTHPPLHVRLEALATTLTPDLIASATRKPDASASSQLDDFERFEKRLTELDRERLRRYQGAVLAGSFPQMMLRSLVLMATTPGQPDANKLETLKKIFKNVTGAEAKDADVLGEVASVNQWRDELLRNLGKLELVLSEEVKLIWVKALLLMAKADGTVDAAERDLVARIGAAMKLAEPFVAKAMTDVG